MQDDVNLRGQPCWALIWLWTLSIAQYSYRYILHVNDSRTTSYYESTPPALSAIKYGIFILFFVYAMARFSHSPASLSARSRRLAQFTACGILVFGSILLVRTAFFPGDFEETSLCAMQLLPWLASALLIPFFVKSSHSVLRTLAAFEQIAFWITFSFWLMTVSLALADIRYPALSYPGVLLRFGGILDDPNGYACLCLLLMMLSLGIRKRHWILRSIIYSVMVAGTVSLTGYVTALIICFSLAIFQIYKAQRSAARWLLIGSVVCGMTLTAFVVLPSMYNISQAMQLFSQVYSTKGSSATTHLLDLLPTENTLQEVSVIGLLFGTGGFSENFYWRVLANFGVVGLLVITVLLAICCSAVFSLNERWRRTLTAWNIGVLVGSNGIAYLLSFPLGLIFWSAAAFLLSAGQSAPITRSTRRHQLSPTTV